MTSERIEPDTLEVRVIQVSPQDGEEVEARVRRVTELVREQKGADLVVLPELWAPGYFTFPEWLNRSETLDGPTVAALARAAAEIGAVVHLGSLLERTKSDTTAGAPPGHRGLWNTSVVLGRDGARLAAYRKIHPFGFGEGEPTLIDPGENVTIVEVESASSTVVVGLATCYDLRFPELFRQMAYAGSQLFVVPAAWPAARREHWEILGRARAIENQAYVVQCNTGGTHGGVVLGGHSQVISPRGEVLACAGTDEEVLSVQLNMTELHEYRQSFPVLADRRL